MLRSSLGSEDTICFSGLKEGTLAQRGRCVENQSIPSHRQVTCPSSALGLTGFCEEWGLCSGEDGSHLCCPGSPEISLRPGQQEGEGNLLTGPAGHSHSGGHQPAALPRLDSYKAQIALHPRTRIPARSRALSILSLDLVLQTPPHPPNQD